MAHALLRGPPRPAPQISALHIESVLLEHPLIGEVAVLGLPDPEYGEVSCQGGAGTVV